MEDLAGWIAPFATALAACMTAANLGARVTGWGFVVFTVGSLAWVTVGITTHQANLLWSNGFLTLVNLIGIWRWLFQRARFADGASAAAAGSAKAPTPTLFSVSLLQDQPVCDDAGATSGHSVDAMAECGSGRIGYVVVREGGAAGIGERLHAVPWRHFSVHDARLQLDLSREALAALDIVDPRDWRHREPAP